MITKEMGKEEANTQSISWERRGKVPKPAWGMAGKQVYKNGLESFGMKGTHGHFSRGGSVFEGREVRSFEVLVCRRDASVEGVCMRLGTRLRRLIVSSPWFAKIFCLNAPCDGKLTTSGAPSPPALTCKKSFPSASQCLLLALEVPEGQDKPMQCLVLPFCLCL